jgi:hypothetical protein
MQSFTFDNANRRLFVAQVMDGADAEDNGDLYINQLDFAGSLLGSMTLRGFGHGVSIGVEPVGSASYLWTEVDSVNACGTRIARFRYAEGTTLQHDDQSLRKFTPVGGDTMTCAVDPINERLAVRHRTGETFRIAVYDLAAAATGDFTHPLADIAQPTDLGTFQGYTIYSDYLYLLEGDAYSGTNPPPGDCGSATIAGNSRMTSVHLNTRQVQQHRVPTKAACTLSYREPEGMAIYRTTAGETRLFFGFASGESVARRCNILYKNALKPKQGG